MKATILVLMKRGLTVLAAILFLSVFLYGQIIIKERVSINPRSQNSQMQIFSNPVPPAATIRLEVSYSGSVNPNPNNTHHTKYFNPYCGESSSGDWYGEPISYETPATAGAGAIGTFSLEPISEGLFSIKWYYGNLIIRDQSSWVSCLPCTVVNFPYYDDMGGGFSLNKPSDILHDGTCNLSKQYPIAHEPCVSPGWVDTFGITISITEGAVYGEFRNASGVSLGNSFMCYLNEINTHYYIANGEKPDSSGGTVCIQATSGSITSETSFKVWKQPVLEKFIVTMDPDTIPNYEYSWISVHPVDNFGNTYPLTDNARITLTATPGMGVFYPAVPTYKQIKDHSVVYSANFEPEQLQDIDITASALSVSGTAKVTVWSGETCPLMQLSAAEINPGDTVTITMTASYWNGTQGPYQPNQKFDIKLNTGQAYGKLYSPSTHQEGSSLTDVPQPIKFIAANSIDEDSVVVEIDVWPKDGGSSALIGDGTKDTFTLQQSVSDSRLKEIISTERKVENVTLPMSKVKVVEQDEAQTSASKDVPSIEKLNKPQQTLNADPPCSPRGWVTINGLHHFEVEIIPDTVATADTIAFTEGAKLIIQAQDRDSNDIEYDANTLLKFSLTTNEEYGTFIKANGDTLKTAPVELTNVLYSDAKAGKIKFAAVKKNPDSVITCRIRVEKQIDTTKHGEKAAVVLEQTLKIVMDQPYQVRPLIPTENGNQTLVNQRRKPLEVRMTRGGQPVSNHPFRLWTDYVKGSGGHIHGVSTDSARRNTNDDFGYFIVGQSKRHPLDTLTNTSGRFSTIYSSSLFGDTMRIYLKSKNKPVFFDSISVVEKVDSLIDFKRYHRPTDSMWTFNQLATTSVLRHPDNNWCTTKMADNLQLALFDFYHWAVSSDSGVGVALFVSLNDMSLELGGRFDIDALWEGVPPGITAQQLHYFHRKGNSVDINPTVRDIEGNEYTLKTKKAPNGWTLLKKLTKLMKDYGGDQEPEKPIHYEFFKGK